MGTSFSCRTNKRIDTPYVDTPHVDTPYVDTSKPLEKISSKTTPNIDTSSVDETPCITKIDLLPKGFTVVLFSNNWCPSCVDQKDDFDNLSQKYLTCKNKFIEITNIELDTPKVFIGDQTFEIEYYPTVFIFHNGHLARKFEGRYIEDLQNFAKERMVENKK